MPAQGRPDDLKRAAPVYPGRMTEPEVRNNRGAGRYELSTPQGLAFVEYRPAGKAVMFTHTEVNCRCRNFEVEPFL